jgi:ABC-type sulfate/molybdate transport systems ATPase subunit
MLSAEDRDWLEEKFNRVHERIDQVENRVAQKGSDIHRIEREVIQLAAGNCEDIQKHEEKYHNPAKNWGTIAAFVGVVTGIIEAVKFWKRGGP